MGIAVNRTVAAEDRPRLSRQCEAILALLRQQSRTNRELADVALKYTSRLSDLRAAGYVIDCERIGEGLTRYTLRNVEPTQLELVH